MLKFLKSTSQVIFEVLPNIHKFHIKVLLICFMSTKGESFKEVLAEQIRRSSFEVVPPEYKPENSFKFILSQKIFIHFQQYINSQKTIKPINICTTSDLERFTDIIENSKLDYIDLKKKLETHRKSLQKTTLN